MFALSAALLGFECREQMQQMSVTQMSVTPDVTPDIFMIQQQYNADKYAQQWPNQFAAAGGR